MLKQALTLWKKERNIKGTTLHRRLLLFFLSLSVLLILCFTLLLTLFGITGKGEETIQNHMNTELANISQTIANDFGHISLSGINIAEDIAKRCDAFFSVNQIQADDLASHPEILEPLLSEHMSTLINTINGRYCGGVFIMLDATIAPDAENADTAKAGVFIKKTQPTSTDVVGVKLHYLRGPAKLARDNGIMLLGQWHMEYDISGQEFFTKVIESARENPELPLSRLYYWSGRVTLKGNSEAGFLLCVPLRSESGTVFGIFGIEVSDRMFKSLFSPEGGTYDNIFTVMAPACDEELCTSDGIIAGNYYLTGNRLSENLSRIGNKDDFERFSSEAGSYGGKSKYIRLYPDGSPYEEEKWSVAILMPQELLDQAIKGDVSYLIYIVIALLIVSLLTSVFISRRYLRPVTDALQSIKNTPHEELKAAPYLEINDLFEFLAAKDREHEEEIRQKEQHSLRIQDELTKTQDEYEKAQLEISRLAYLRKHEVDPELYKQFLNNLFTLTPTERNIFNLYISGEGAKDILEILCIKENTLKYHNKNIYSKLGVTSRKELLRYAALMHQEEKAGNDK